MIVPKPIREYFTTYIRECVKVGGADEADERFAIKLLLEGHPSADGLSQLVAKLDISERQLTEMFLMCVESLLSLYRRRSRTTTVAEYEKLRERLLQRF